MVATPCDSPRQLLGWGPHRLRRSACTRECKQAPSKVSRQLILMISHLYFALERSKRDDTTSNLIFHGGRSILDPPEVKQSGNARRTAQSRGLSLRQGNSVAIKAFDHFSTQSQKGKRWGFKNACNPATPLLGEVIRRLLDDFDARSARD